jgi:hypothetical protein
MSCRLECKVDLVLANMILALTLIFPSPGHPLLRSQNHHSAGLTRGRWTHRDFQPTTVEHPRFNPHKSSTMRAEVERRAKQSFGSVSISQAETAEPTMGSQVNVFVFNSGHVSSRDLVLAEDRAAGIFKKEGIRVIWVAGLTAREPMGHPIGEAWNPADLDLRLWTRSLARGTAIHSNALGYCLSIERGQAIILSDAIQNLAARWGIDLADILGVAMAHEIGHLLLRTSSHSTLGMMKAPYLQKDLTSAGREGLIFTREEGNSMRNEVRRR